MRTHIKAMTYEPKVPDVLSGTCTQTIRPKSKYPVKAGDTVLFHGWQGKPYKSKWSWRLRVEVTEVIDIEIRDNGIIYPFWSDQVILWDHPINWNLAKMDFIKPATGLELERVLKSMHGDFKEPQLFQIIRWERGKQISN